jgi:hypothetical protein|tara:strand:+ start:2793 stop:3239 length:447 start_codon:yes stop_codon:yes gene_type:complete
MSNTRTPRSSENRDTQKRTATWDNSGLLPDPEPRAGLEHRYVRATSRGEVDNINLSRALRDGWVPVQAQDYKELHVMSDRGSEFPDGVVIGGLVLCARPIEYGDQRRDKKNEEVKNQMKAVDQNYLRSQDSRMQKFSDKNTRVTFGDN